MTKRKTLAVTWFCRK